MSKMESINCRPDDLYFSIFSARFSIQCRKEYTVVWKIIESLYSFAFFLNIFPVNDAFAFWILRQHIDSNILFHISSRWNMKEDVRIYMLAKNSEGESIIDRKNIQKKSKWIEWFYNFSHYCIYTKCLEEVYYINDQHGEKEALDINLKLRSINLIFF